MGKIMVVAGEVSGDFHAAQVVKEMKLIAPETQFLGMGSTCLKQEGVKVIIDPTGISTIGFWEAFKNLKEHLSHLKIMTSYLDGEKPDVLFLVDYSGFNMQMARIAKKRNIPVVNYFSPAAWTWGRWRARWMAKNKAIIASVFPMEAEVYREVGAKVCFVGHPLLDLVKIESEPQEIFAELELDLKRPVIGLLPGSRKGEIDRLLPVMLKTAESLQRKKGEYQFVIPLAPGLKRSSISRLAAQYHLVLKVVEGSAYEVMRISDLLLVASGTATLEAAIMGTPMIIIYKTSWSTYHLGKLLVKFDYIGMPNIIAGKGIVPELIQEEANPDRLYQELVRLLNNPYLLQNMRNELKTVKDKLGSLGAVKRTAELVLKEGKIIGAD